MAKLTVFCGKGGVGKSTLGLAFGCVQAGRGLRTLVVTSHPVEELALSISLQGLPERSPQAAANLFVVHIDAREILAARVRQYFRPAVLAGTVLSSRLYQNLVEVAPGLKEIAFLARLKQLAESGGKEGKPYPCVIWDAPASGHFLQTLRVSRGFDQFLTGPFSTMAKDLVRFFNQPGNLRVVPVAILEEMAVAETLEMCGTLRSSLGIDPAAVVCNLVSPLLPLPEAELQALREAAGGGGADAEGHRLVLEKHLQERAFYRELERAIRSPLHLVERVPSWSVDLDLLEAVGASLAQCLEGD